MRVKKPAKPFHPGVLIAVDSAQQTNACAILMEFEPLSAMRTYKIGGVENLGRFKELQLLSDMDLVLAAMLECPTWNGLGTKEVRAGAIAWERELQRLFRTRKVWRCDPKEWQRKLLSGAPGATTKEQSLYRARHVLRVDVEGDSDRADAACILEFLHMKLRGLA